MVLKFFIFQKNIKTHITKDLIERKLKCLTKILRDYLFKVIYLKAADEVGGEIWKYCFFDEKSLRTLSNQIRQMSGVRVDFRHLQKHFCISVNLKLIITNFLFL